MAAAFEEAELRQRNEALERAVMESRHREVELGWELERTRERLRVAEEAEERLCGEIGELEAEAVVQAREYRRRIEALSHRLGSALDLLASAGLHLSPDS
ncbi:protein RESPONSE TO LOW SULFUR 4-like [Curcuma longa]|uniref:protein RESPONSE TO LOW SULFUR 4-like n=1 Tax=Curcuma longa TaxID=136217 RepID=UPI003D9DE264